MNMSFWPLRYNQPSSAWHLVDICQPHLILDNFNVHHIHVVNEWIQNHENEIELFFLPPYSSELIPDEHLNCDLKSGVHSGSLARSKSQSIKKALSHRRMLYIYPKCVTKYFKHPYISYTALVCIFICRVNNTEIGIIIYKFLIPACSFGVLGLICNHKNPDGMNRFSVSSLVGTIAGVFIGNTLPYVLLWFSVLNYKGAG